MLFAARKTDKTAHGGVILEGEPTVIITGQWAARKGDAAECKTHGGGPITTSSRTVYIGNALAARIFDQVGCGAVGKSGKDVPAVLGGPASPWKAEGPYARGKSGPGGDEGEAGLFRGEVHKDLGGGRGIKGQGDFQYGKGKRDAAGIEGEVGGLKVGSEGYWGPKGDGGANPYLAQGNEVVAGRAEAKKDVLLGDDGNRTGFALTGKAEVQAGAVKHTDKGTVPLGWIPGVPDDYNVQFRGQAEVAEGVGGGVGQWAYWDKKEERFHLGGLGALELGIGLSLDINISIGKKYPPTPAPGGGDGSGDGGIPNQIITGEQTVLIG